MTWDGLDERRTVETLRELLDSPNERTRRAAYHELYGTPIAPDPMTKHYDTVTKPALRALERAAFEPAPLADIKAAADAAATAGATRHEIAEAVGGVTAWNALVSVLREAGLVGKAK